MISEAGNTTFLIEYTYYPDFHLSDISIPVIDIRSPDLEKPGQRAAVLVHDGIGKFTVLLKVEISGDKYGEVIYNLTKRVDAVIRDILDKEGSDNYEAAHAREVRFLKGDLLSAQAPPQIVSSDRDVVT